MAGEYYSASITTSGGDEDLFDTINTALGKNVVAKSVELVSANDIGICINNQLDGLGAYIYSKLHLESALYKMSLQPGEVLVSSLRIQTSGHVVWIKIVF